MHAILAHGYKFPCGFALYGAVTGVSRDNVKEMVWWEEATLKGEKGISFKVVFTRTNHWCKRFIGDDNKSLWGSWAVVWRRHWIL